VTLLIAIKHGRPLNQSQSSAMAIKLRTGQISLAQRGAALAMFNRLVAESFTVLAATGGHFRAAAKFVDQHRYAGSQLSSLIMRLPGGARSQSSRRSPKAQYNGCCIAG